MSAMDRGDDLEAAVCVVLADKAEVRTYGNEVNIKTLITSAVFAQASAL